MRMEVKVYRTTPWHNMCNFCTGKRHHTIYRSYVNELHPRYRQCKASSRAESFSAPSCLNLPRRSFEHCTRRPSRLTTKVHVTMQIHHKAQYSNPARREEELVTVWISAPTTPNHLLKSSPGATIGGADAGLL